MRKNARRLMHAKLVILSALLIACNRYKDEWVLESYDANNGYVFMKNGVRYQATCSATGYPVLGAPPNTVPDTNPDALPPLPAYSETACSDVLEYLNKPVPNLKSAYGSVLLLTKKNNFRLEFEIQQAK